ncbi:phage tail protein [Thalassospira sp.]|uniref:phage tail protein n=1 Tax=Thalassospira sp. TaxID=1912094 RepID=UPI0027366BDB|nr:tail fiber protein [Thalassospira sp.]MDP2698449.1 tail fiber protein [Thalassospira sp.]
MRPGLSTCILAGTAAFAALAAMTLRPAPAAACNLNGYIGSICWTAISFCPEGYLPAYGQNLQIGQYQALYALYGTTYGGSARQGNFNLPDMMGREPVGTGTGPGLFPMEPEYPINGPEKVTLTTANLPLHDHGVNIPADSKISVAVQETAGSLTMPAGNVLAAPQNTNVKIYADTTDATMAAGMVSAHISGQQITSGITPGTDPQPMAVLGPQLGMLACVNYDGYFPINPN